MIELSHQKYRCSFMSVKLRLQRGGAKNRPVYRIVAADSRCARDGRFLEKLGTFFPKVEDPVKKLLNVSSERVMYWIGQGAQCTNTVKKILAHILPISKTAPGTAA